MVFDPIAFNAILEKFIPVLGSGLVTVAGIWLTLRAQGENLNKQLEDQARQKVQERLATARRSIYVPYIEAVHKAVGLVFSLPNPGKEDEVTAAFTVAQAETYKVQLLCETGLFDQVKEVNSQLAILYILAQELAGPIRDLVRHTGMLEEQLKLIQVELIENGKLTGFAAIGNRDSLEKRQVRLRGEFSEFLRRLTKMRENFTECVEDRCRLVTKLAYQSIVTMRAEVEASTDVNLLIAGAGQAGERVEAETASSSARRRRVFGKKWIAKTLDTEGRIRKIRQVVRKAFAAMQGLFSF